MIRISTRGRYAVRAMLDLAQHGDNGPVPRQEIAARQEVSADYVTQLFRQLQAAGLVDGIKGPGGGYRLARDAARITVGDLIRVVEGPIALVQCVLPDAGPEPPCHRIDGCVTHLLWVQLSKSLSDMLDSVTLQDLADQSQRLFPGKA